MLSALGPYHVQINSTRGVTRGLINPILGEAGGRIEGDGNVVFPAAIQAPENDVALPTVEGGDGDGNGDGAGDDASDATSFTSGTTPSQSPVTP